MSSTIDTTYCRVIPRDLFNEAKLLKCIGRLVLLIHDGQGLNGMTFEHDDEPFQIGLMDDGHLAITNIAFEMNGQKMFFKSQYNSKSNWPLLLEHDYCEYPVFDENGNYDNEFINFCNSILAGN